MTTSGPELYRRNPFRITGLPTDVAPRQLRQRRQEAHAQRSLGRPPAVAEERLPPPGELTWKLVLAAFDAVGDTSQDRLVNEVFWWWGTPNGCGCSRRLHRMHDDAVWYHATALDAELATTDQPRLTREQREEWWTRVADAWSDALSHAQFWNHIEHRVTAVNDRRLGPHTVDQLRDEVPALLLSPQSALAAADDTGQHMELMGRWRLEPSVIDDARAAAAAPLLERTKELVAAISAMLDAGDAEPAARRALDDLVPTAQRLRTWVSRHRIPRGAWVQNQAAVILNNVAVALMNGGRGGEQAVIEDLLTRAEELAVQPDTQQNIRVNSSAATIRGRVTSGATAGAELGKVMRFVFGLDFLALATAVMLGPVEASTALAAIVAVAGTPLALSMGYTHWHASGNLRRVDGLAMLGAFAAPIVLVWQAIAAGLTPVLVCLAAFLFCLPVTRPLGRGIAWMWYR